MVKTVAAKTLFPHAVHKKTSSNRLKTLSVNVPIAFPHLLPARRHTLGQTLSSSSLLYSMKTLIKLLISVISIMVCSQLLPGVHLQSTWTAVSTAIVISLLNVFLRPLLLFLTLPITILTFGLFLLFINVIIIAVANYLIDGFVITGFWNTIIFSFVYSLIISFMEYIFGLNKKEDKKN